MRTRLIGVVAAATAALVLPVAAQATSAAPQTGEHRAHGDCASIGASHE